VSTFKHDHGGHGTQCTGEEFLGLENELRFEEVGYAELEAVIETEVVEDGRKDVGVVGIEFDLTREVNK